MLLRRAIMVVMNTHEVKSRFRIFRIGFTLLLSFSTLTFSCYYFILPFYSVFLLSMIIIMLF